MSAYYYQLKNIMGKRQNHDAGTVKIGYASNRWRDHWFQVYFSENTGKIVIMVDFTRTAEIMVYAPSSVHMRTHEHSVRLSSLFALHACAQHARLLTGCTMCTCVRLFALLTGARTACMVPAGYALGLVSRIHQAQCVLTRCKYLLLSLREFIVHRVHVYESGERVVWLDAAHRDLRNEVRVDVTVVLRLDFVLVFLVEPFQCAAFLKQ